jgi:hypothetical protein
MRLKHGRHTCVASCRTVASGRISCALFLFCSHTPGPQPARAWPVAVHAHTPAESSRAGHWQNTSVRTRGRASLNPSGPPGPATPPSFPPAATPFACRQTRFYCSSAPLRVLLLHGRPRPATPPGVLLLHARSATPPPSATGPALASALPCLSSIRTHPCRVRPWPVSRVCCSCSSAQEVAGE